MVESQQRGGIVAPESCDLVLVYAVESELVGKPAGNADEPAEAVGQGAVEVEDSQLESQGTLSVEGWKGWMDGITTATRTFLRPGNRN